jgi:alpha-tubulin suppressor-like RCC1 family protein
MRTRPFIALATTGLLVALAATPAGGQPVPAHMAEPVAAAPAPSPGPEAALTGVRAMATGYYHSCAVLTSGQVRCAGDNGSGQLGGGNTDIETATVVVRNPTNTGPLTGVTQVAGGVDHTCALLTSREVRCWGDNDSGQLGDGTLTDRLYPVPVKSPSGPGRLTGVVQISADADRTCAVIQGGLARCWGDNDAGQIGDGTAGTDRRRPRPVRAVTGTGVLTGVSQIDVGYYLTCARLTNGQARCWGQNVEGGLGDGTVTERHRPVVVRTVAGAGALAGVRQISAGAYHSCATLTNGQVRCWGYGGDGQLGIGTTAEHHRPVVVRTISGPGALVGVAQVAAGYYHTCARLTSGQARCWGNNGYFEVGNGLEDMIDVPRPTPVRNTQDSAALVGVRQLHATDFHTCVTLTNGQGRCWGYDETGALSGPTNGSSALPVIFNL